MRTNSLSLSQSVRYQRLTNEPLSLVEAMKIYLSILVGVTAFLLAFHATLFPLFR